MLSVVASVAGISVSGPSDQNLQEFLKGLIGLLDVAGLYFALTQLTCRGINKSDKFQAVGLGESRDGPRRRQLPLLKAFLILMKEHS